MLQVGAESVDALASLPELRSVTLRYCDALTTIRPLAACSKLVELKCDCDNVRGPRTLEALRAPPKPPVKRYASAGPPTLRAGELAVFDARNHLPKKPPEHWSVPQRSLENEQQFVIEAEHGFHLMVALQSQDRHHAVLVWIIKHEGARATDKEAARLLRRIRSCDAFVETDAVVPDDSPSVRMFIAVAHAASPQTWGPFREDRPLLRVEPSVERVGEPMLGGVSDVRQHLPSPLPAGWSIDRSEGPDECKLRAPGAQIVVRLDPAAQSDILHLAVGLFPERGDELASVSDPVARALLAPFRARGVFEESRTGPFARAPGMRVFKARVAVG